MKILRSLIFMGCLLMVVANLFAADKIKVVTTFSDFASITKEIAGDLVEVEYLSHGDQDPHFVNACRVELEELHILSRYAPTHGDGYAITGIGMGIGGNLPHAPPSSGGEDDCLGMEDMDLSRK